MPGEAKPASSSSPETRALLRPRTFSALLLGSGLVALLALTGVGPARRLLENHSEGIRAAQHAAAIEAVMAEDPRRQRRQDLTERARRHAGDAVEAGFFVRTPTDEKLACITFRGGDMHAPEPYLVRIDLDTLGRMLAVRDELDFTTYWALYKRCRTHANLTNSVN
ncbi:hypothetical protein [Rhodovulum sulfidophilum]|uniref:hypothetical protein n=1 Tax=Rhodovulum sulfidophilum TaxID=35806 RepID=UPI0009526412|nr:hypothetical protein [Rhodovulum sulfidophilum]MBK5924833.1 hypothetical protein [Rhodovulum sulfidophilum]OLS53853.1 hypothetical protein BV392_18930 [Rhodovulum sulfidophilum]